MSELQRISPEIDQTRARIAGLDDAATGSGPRLPEEDRSASG
jgi:hypothetical protein